MAEEIKQRITIEADEAIARLKAVTGLEFELAKGVDTAAESGRKKSGVMEFLTGQVKGLGAAMLGGISAVGLFTASLRQMVQDGRDAAAAMKDLADARRELTSELGFGASSTIARSVDEMSRAMKFRPEQRAGMMRAVASFSNLRPGAAPQELDAFVTHGAIVSKATGVTGDSLAQMMADLSSVPGLNMATAEDPAVALIQAGMRPDEISQIAKRFGSLGGKDLLQAVAGARPFGLAGENQRRLLSMLAGLDQRDERGRLSRTLRAAGIAENMPILDRLKTVMAARASGRISEGTFMGTIGGAGNLGLAEAMGRFFAAGQPFDWQGASGNAVIRQWGDPALQFADEMALAELNEQIANENATGDAMGELVRKRQEVQYRMQGRSGATRFLGGVLYNIRRFLGVDPEQAVGGTGSVPEMLLGSGAARPVVNIQTQINTGVNPHTDVRPPEVP